MCTAFQRSHLLLLHVSSLLLLCEGTIARQSTFTAYHCPPWAVATISFKCAYSHFLSPVACIISGISQSLLLLGDISERRPRSSFSAMLLLRATPALPCTWPGRGASSWSRFDNFRMGRLPGFPPYACSVFPSKVVRGAVGPMLISIWLASGVQGGGSSDEIITWRLGLTELYLPS